MLFPGPYAKTIQVVLDEWPQIPPGHKEPPVPEFIAISRSAAIAHKLKTALGCYETWHADAFHIITADSWRTWETPPLLLRCTASWHWQCRLHQEESRLGGDLSTCCLCPPWTQNTCLTGPSCWPPFFFFGLLGPLSIFSFSGLYPEQLIHRPGLQDGVFSPWNQQALRTDPYHMIAASVLQERGIAGGTPRDWMPRTLWAEVQTPPNRLWPSTMHYAL